MVYLNQRVGELRRGDRVAARSIGLDDDRDLEVVSVQNDPDAPDEMILLGVAIDAVHIVVERQSPERVVRMVVPEYEQVPPDVRQRCADRYAVAGDRPEMIASLFGVELLSLQWRLSRNRSNPIIVPVGWAPGDGHPLDVTIDDVEEAAVDALGNLIVYLRSHGYDADALVARAIDYSTGDLDKTGLNRRSREEAIDE
jgi:hypothetical protein